MKIRPVEVLHPRVTDVWGESRPMPRGGTWAPRVDEYLEPGTQPGDVERWVRSACVLCSNGCGLEIAVRGERIVGVRGSATDRVNRGRLGPKGLLGWQGQQRDRLTRPMVRRSGTLREVDWDEAMDTVVRRSRALLDQRGPLSHAFYTSGQLMLEEYYTLAVIGKAGLGTPHMDGNTRLCTATAAASLKESFGADGQPGSYADLDHCDAMIHFGHNVAETQTVLWTRMLDRLAGPNPPLHVTIDPRRTEVARLSTVHLAVRPGTNVALVNGLLHEIVRHDWVDHQWVEAHTRGYEELARSVAAYPPDRVAQICQVAAADVSRAAEIIGTAPRFVSTVLQGFYQSHQATAAAVLVNDLHLVRGMLGRPGAGILQMNGQPTAQNNREAGANGDMPGFRNWDNPAHVEQLARLWDVDPSAIPHATPPTPAMQIFRYAEQGSVRFLWVAGTNPAVSMPHVDRIRRILGQESLFLVVNDGYATETTEYADVVLPAALWGERTGTFTNADRTVHLADQAVAPPGEARSDLAIWVDYARRMGFRDNSGRPIPRWSTPEEAFAAWQECSAGRPCDYTGLSYELLRERGGVQWPCTAEQPDGTERLYTDAVFPSGVDYCETYGHDLETGASVTPEQHAALHLDGRAWLRTAEYEPADEQPDETYPFLLNTGRTVFHFHTRTKTARAPELQAAAPDPWVELHPADARELGIAEGEPVVVESRRGAVTLPARLMGDRRGEVFIPFHYGADPANALTLDRWDPVSKQPQFKGGAVGVRIQPDGNQPEREER